MHTYMCLNTYMYMYMYIYIYIYICIFKYIHIYAYICIYIYTNKFWCDCTQVHAYILFVCMHAATARNIGCVHACRHGTKRSEYSPKVV